MGKEYKDLLNNIEMHNHYKAVAELEYKYNQELFNRQCCLIDTREASTFKPLDKLVQDLNKYENMIYLENEHIKALEEQKVAIDQCINQSNITVKVERLRVLGLSQEQVAELVERTPRQVQNIERKLREGY